MYLNDIEATCFIMALFIRDDGLRFLLGTGAYEFKDSQLHFSGNTIENDVVSVQGNDGYMLAGQVRRPSTQVFDGYIGDATVSKAEVEGFRRDFFTFFRKNHFYTVVYVLPDGSAIQRRRGFLVDAPTVKELRQMYPEYHVGLNFEDVNYYKYAEDDAGQEIYGKSADIGLAKAQFGGLIWDDRTQTQINKSGSNFAAIGTIDNEPIDSIELQGDTQQKTISGAQLLTKDGMATPSTDTSFWNSFSSSVISSTPQNNGWTTITQTSTGYGNFYPAWTSIKNMATSTTYTLILELKNVSNGSSTINTCQPSNAADPCSSFEVVTGASASTAGQVVRLSLSAPEPVSVVKFTTKSSSVANGIRMFTNNSVPVGCKFDLRVTVLLGDHSSDWENYVGTNWQPFVGGVASPNPDYPQEVQTVTGLQTIQIMDATKGKNLFDKDNPSYMGGYFEIGGTISTSSSNRNRIIYIPCEANTTYSLTKATGTWAGGSWTLGVCHEIPAAGVQVYNAVGIGKSTTYSGYTTDSNSIYLVLRCQNADSTTYAWYNQVEDTGLTVWQTVLAGLQIEKGSQATSYVPYTTQTYEVNLGKNVLENIGTTETKPGGITFTVNADKSVTVSGVATSANWFKLAESLQLDGDYYMSGCPTGGSTTKYSLQTSYGGTVSGDYGGGVQLHAGTTDPVWIVIRSGQDFSTPVTFYPQIERGNVATSYAPYFTPIELCKIGNYQDYIYKNNGNWYLHKATTSFIIDGTKGGFYSTSNWYYISFSNLNITRVGDSSSLQMYSRYFTPYNYNTLSNNISIPGAAQSSTNFVVRNLNCSDGSEYQTWFASVLPKFYYPLATATDTQITDATLISELEALNAATTFGDVTWFKSSSDDLPVIMDVDLQAWVGGGVSWDANGAEWEDGGGGQIVNVTIDSIDSVYPVWIVNGEAVNPTLTNLTTGMSITYDGTVANGQQLVVDMLNKTAKLSGTSVIQDISGQWVEFIPGINRVTYSADNSDAPDSSIEWQEVVG